MSLLRVQPTGPVGRFASSAARGAPVFVLVTMVLCALTLGAGYANKVRCVGPSFDADGRSQPNYTVRVARDVCYSDIQYLWIGRDIDRHVFPYVHGGYRPVSEQLFGGSLEYPVLTGMAIWLAAIPSATDGDFLFWSAILLAVAGLTTAALLAWLAGLRSWWFALAPPLVLYAFHNWDLLAVCATVVAFWILLRAGRPGGSAEVEPVEIPPADVQSAEAGSAAAQSAQVGSEVGSAEMRSADVRASPEAGATGPGTRPGNVIRPAITGRHVISRPGPLVAAAVALGIGAAFKLYPLMFALPIALWLIGGGWQPAAAVRHRTRGRWLAGFFFAAGTAGVFALINLPFVIAGPAGWWASFQFQWSRPIDLTTNTIWFWGFRPYSDSGNDVVQHDLGLAAAATTLGALLLACVLGWLRYGRNRAYPWLPVCAAMVCGYLLFNKVHSPQFVLWLLPFFVLLRIRAGWILAYFAADAAIGIGFFRWQYLIGSGAPSGTYDALSPQFVLIGVWGRAALLVALFVVFLRAWVVEPPDRGPAPAPDPAGQARSQSARPQPGRPAGSDQPSRAGQGGLPDGVDPGELPSADAVHSYRP